ncbi:MAG: Mth938-like domain-containing protein [Xanthobacteraceae bacterium]
MSADDSHLPQPAAIDAYGKGGFRFAEMSHRGSILCLPVGIWAWPIVTPDEITEESLARVFGSGVELFMLGTGKQPWFMPEGLRWRFRDARIGLEVTPTGAAVRTYNILFGERRKVGAALIAVD